MLLPGQQAARVRRQAAELLVKYLGGDLALVDEVCRLRGFQEEMAAQRPEDPRRIFGEAVEASGSHGPMGEQMMRMMSTMERRLAAQDEVLERIQERLGRDHQHVNLNVRAPKRPLPRDPPIARDIAGAGRPFPVATFLDTEEREDPTWRETRRSFAPTFGMLIQVLKKKKLKEEGRPAVYVEQNQRAQLLYTEEDREPVAAWMVSSSKTIVSGWFSKDLLLSSKIEKSKEDQCSLKELIRRKGVPPKVGSLNDPAPNQEQYHEGKAIYINEPGFYTIVLGSKKPECRAFKRWVTKEKEFAWAAMAYMGCQSSSGPQTSLWVHTVRPHIKLLQCFSRYGLYCNPLKHTCFEVLRHA